MSEREYLRNVPLSEIPQKIFEKRFSMPVQNGGIFKKKNTYLVSNEWPTTQSDWSEKAKDMPKRSDGVVIAIMGGLDTALNFFCTTAPQEGKDNRDLVLIDINKYQKRLSKWKMDLFKISPSFLSYAAYFYPLPPNTREMLLTSENELPNPFDERSYRKIIGRIFLKIIETHHTDTSFDGIRLGISKLGYPKQEATSLYNAIVEHKQMRRNAQGLIKGHILGSIQEPISNLLFQEEDQLKYFWQEQNNYQLIRSAIFENRIKIIRLPMQSLPESELMKTISDLGLRINSLHVSNIFQYIKTEVFEKFVYQIQQKIGADALIQFHVCDYENIARVVTLGELGQYKNEILTRNWLAGNPDKLDP